MSKRSSVTEAPAEGGVLNLSAIGAPSHPQVNLLPPEVHSRRGLKRTKIILGLSLIGVFLLVLVGFGFAFLSVGTAATDLAIQDAEVERLLTEQEQYAEVPLVKGQIARAELSRELATSNEISWFDYLEAVRAVKPEGWAITSILSTMPTANDSPLMSPDPLSPAGVGALTFTARADLVPQISEWIVAAESVPGFNDPRVSSAQITENEGDVFYEVTTTVIVDETAFAQRFVEEPETATDDSQEGED